MGIIEDLNVLITMYREQFGQSPGRIVMCDRHYLLLCDEIARLSEGKILGPLISYAGVRIEPRPGNWVGMMAEEGGGTDGEEAKR